MFFHSPFEPGCSIIERKPRRESELFSTHPSHHLTSRTVLHSLPTQNLHKPIPPILHKFLCQLQCTKHALKPVWHARVDFRRYLRTVFLEELRVNETVVAEGVESIDLD